MANVTYSGTYEKPAFLANQQDFTAIGVTIDTTSRDEGNSVDTTDLRAGLVMVKDSNLASGYFAPLETEGTGANTADLRTAVILMHDVYDIDDAVQNAEAVFMGEVWESKIYYNGKGSTNLTAAQKDTIQRLMLRPV